MANSAFVRPERHERPIIELVSGNALYYFIFWKAFLARFPAALEANNRKM
jgi:hypothetical protein